MHILLASTNHLSHMKGGNEIYTHQLALGLSQHHQVTYLTSSANSSKPNSLPYRLITQPVNQLIDHPLPSHTFYKQATQVKPDIYHATGSGAHLIATAFLFKKSLPTILTYQADSTPTSKLNAAFNSMQQTAIRHSFSHLITTSPYYQKLLQQRWPHLAVRYVPLMVKPVFHNQTIDKKEARNQLGWNSQTRYVLSVSNLTPHHYYKDLDTLLKAMKKLPQITKLVHIGTGPLLKQYRQKVKALNLTSRVQFAGAVNDQKLSQYYAAADVFVLPSKNASEGFGLVLLEAMAHQTPTITTTIVGSASILKKHDVSWLVPPQNPTALARAIKSITTKPNVEKIKRAHHFAHTFTRKSMVEKTLSYYHKALKDYA